MPTTLLRYFCERAEAVVDIHANDCCMIYIAMHRFLILSKCIGNVFVYENTSPPY